MSPPTAAAEARRVLRGLRDLIADRALSQRQIEDRCGLGRGYLSQLLAANIDLKYRHVLAVLQVLDVTPGAFFGGLYPPPRSGGEPERIVLPADQDTASVYSFGLESLQALRERLERCEDALTELHETGVLDGDGDDRGRPDGGAEPDAGG